MDEHGKRAAEYPSPDELELPDDYHEAVFHQVALTREHQRLAAGYEKRMKDQYGEGTPPHPPAILAF